VVEKVYQSTKGQPGLVSWFGELLTEKHNQGHEQVSFHSPLCNYFYLHGIIEPISIQTSNGKLDKICCFFSSPFIQDCLYYALTDDIIDDIPILPLQPLDNLADVFEGTSLNLPALLTRYKDYLARLRAQGINTWKEQPRRKKTDLKLTEAVGQFHLFTWLREAVKRRCVVSPEFPTGSGKVDIHLQCGKLLGIIEVKNFVDSYQIKKNRKQAADYAKNLAIDNVTIALFIPVLEETVLEKLSTQKAINGVEAIGWV
jgi:hypothetical protein